MLITLLTTKQYLATATVEISRQEARVVKIDGINPETTTEDHEFYQTQYTLLQSDAIARSLIQRLHLDTDVSFFATFKVDPVSRDSWTGSGQATGRSAAEQRVEAARKLLWDHIQINPVRNSRLVNISFMSPDPQLSRKIANAWAEEFIASTLARRYRSTSYARIFLESRLNQLRDRLQDSERKLVDYAARNRIVNVTSSEQSGTAPGRVEHSLENDDLVSLNEALIQAHTDKIRAQSRFSQGVFGTNDGNSGALLATLRQRRAEAMGDYSRLIVRFAPTYPAAKALFRQIATFDRAIATEQARIRQDAQNALNEAATREAVLSRGVSKAKEQLVQLRNRSIQYGIYQRDVETNRELYEGVLERYKEIGVASGVGVSNVALADPAQVPKEASIPNLGFNLAIALAIGLVVAGITIFVLEQIDEYVKDPSDVEEAIGLPLLGVIPKADVDPADALRDPRSGFTEAYVSLQALLQFTTSHGVPRSIAVTSTHKGEGKSTTSYSIALLLARTGRRVALIDADMRSPSVHRICGLPNLRGTSNFLAGDKTLSLLQATEAPTLKAMTAGPIPPSPAELLVGSGLADLLDMLLRDFDHVIIDAPPVLGIADAPLIGHTAEALLYVVETQRAKVNLIRSSLQRLADGGVAMLGIVLTKFDSRKNGYGYDYSYGYE